MFDVIGIAGPKLGKVCFLCEYGSEPVVIAFIEPSSPKAEAVVDAIQRLSAKYSTDVPGVRGLIVFLSPPEPEIKRKLIELANKKKLSIPLAVLPEGMFPPLLYENSAEVTIVLYRGRRIVQTFTDLDSLKRLSPMSSKTIEPLDVHSLIRGGSTIDGGSKLEVAVDAMVARARESYKSSSDER